MTITLVIGIVVSLAVLEIATFVTVIKLGWGPLPRDFPATEPGDDAVWRRYQSFRLGFVNTGCCIHVAADEQYLHLVPLKPLRALGGRPASIPWDAIRIEKRSPDGRWITAQVGRHTLRGPSWCLELASGT